VINTNGRDNAMISATVSLKRATPNETYTVRISRNSTVEHFVCFSVAGQAVTLTTNRQGNGTVHVRVPRGFPPDVPANTVTSAKVTLAPSSGPPVAIATPVVPLR
jgi:hypothetical protein